jgi:hypothetical protein
MFRNTISVFFLSFLISVVATMAYDHDDYDVCFDWKSYAQEFKKAYAKWKAPSCYSFTFHDWAVEYGEGIKRVIKNGKALRKKPYRALQTIDDFYKLIKKECFQDCPHHGASFCDIEYTKDRKSGLVYPSRVFIRRDPDNSDDYDSYFIEDLCINKCDK